MKKLTVEMERVCLQGCSFGLIQTIQVEVGDDDVEKTSAFPGLSFQASWMAARSFVELAKKV